MKTTHQSINATRPALGAISEPLCREMMWVVVNEWLFQFTTADRKQDFIGKNNDVYTLSRINKISTPLIPTGDVQLL